MSKKNIYYIKNIIKFEPLVFSWPAWPQLIPPITAGLNLKNRYLKIMESYLANPDIHYITANRTDISRAQFINIPPNKIRFLQETYIRIKESTQELTRLAECIHFINTLILKEAKGYSLEPLYNKIPDMLKGMVELYYDINNFPRYRIIEPLVYKKYYNKFHQSIFMNHIQKDFRPFSLSTPHIEEEGEVEINLPFRSLLYDKLFSASQFPVSKDLIEEIFTSKQVDSVIERFFQKTPVKLKENRSYSGAGIRVRYFGHACILIETANISILVDPLISYEYKSEIPRFTLSDLPDKIDYVLFTHAHEDHIVLETILQIRYKVHNFIIPRDTRGNLADPSLLLILDLLGFKNLISLEEFQSIEFINGEILGVPFFGEHCDVEINSKLGYCVTIGSNKFLFLADSNNLEPQLYNLIFNDIGPIDTVFIGMEHEGGPLTLQYGSIITIPIDKKMDQSRRLSASNYSKALNIVEKAKCKNAFIYAMGQEPWLHHIMGLNYNEKSPQIRHALKFIKECKKRGIHSELLFCKREWFID